MLTRFEVSGFKNLNDVVVEFGPFTCVAGPNAVGKSNLFDAIRFLSGLADSTFTEVCAGVRSVEKGYSSNLGSLFPETVMWWGGRELSFSCRNDCPRKSC
ncbi:hypothetical protein BKH23_01330 [Actinomyces oris]|uniref:AAA family ATPase n=1 Tax=Actinomyces TaxID=1654 RepID=UPI00094D1909|nr:hypothetical protein BKH23_01330 [Actinomyces oris]